MSEDLDFLVVLGRFFRGEEEAKRISSAENYERQKERYSDEFGLHLNM